MTRAAPVGPGATALWTAPAVAAVTGGTVVGHWQATGLSLGPDRVRPGDLSVLADPGAGAVAGALARGAVAVMLPRAAAALPSAVPQVRVASLGDALAAMAARARGAVRVVTIAGPFGKATLAAMLGAMLGRQMQVRTLRARTEIDALAGLAALSRAASVVLVQIAPPEGEERGAGQLIARLRPDLCVSAGGAAPAAAPDALRPPGCRALRVHRAGHVTVAEVAATGADPVLIRLASAAPHVLDCALTALATARALGADPALAALDLAAWRPGAGQGAVHRLALDPVEEGSIDVLDAAGNLHPMAFASAFAHLAVAAPGTTGRPSAGRPGRIGTGRRVAVLTAPPPPALDLSAADVIHTAGARAAGVHATLPIHRRGRHLPDGGSLGPQLRRLVHPGDVVLVKGGPEAARVVDALRKLGHRDRQIARERV